MKICLVSQTFAPQEEGGAEIVARMCARELSRDHEVIVLSLGLEGDPVAPAGETVGEDGIRVLRLPWQNSYLPGPRKPAANALTKLTWHIRTALGALSTEAVKRVLLRERVDLVYAHNSARMQPALFHACKALRLPLCVHLHDYALACPRFSMFRGVDNCEKPCLDCRVLTSRINATDGEGVTAIAVSDFLRQRLLRHEILPRADWHVLLNTNRSQTSFDHSLVGRSHATSEHFTFGYLGALTEEKGIADLIQSFLALPDRGQARLLVAGRGREDYVARLKSLAGDAPVDFLGFVPPEEVYKRADVVVLPSRWHEPQSLISIEAATYGVPIIGTALGGTPEILQDLGTGWCYDLRQKHALFDMMERALSIGQARWWSERDRNFPGIRNFKGMSEASGYYQRLNEILLGAWARSRSADRTVA